jgi:dihydrofolate reductase
MGRIVLSEFLTLDGVMQSPGSADEDPSGGFTDGGWQQQRPDEQIGEFVIRGLQEAGGLLLGRRTFDVFASYWPNQPDENPVAPLINAMPKYVASRTLENPLEWHASTVLGPDLVAEVNRLRGEPGGDILVIGSGDLAQTLMREGLVDAYSLMVYPLLLGSGRQLFRGAHPRQSLRLTEGRTTSLGNLILLYEPESEGER